MRVIDKEFYNVIIIKNFWPLRVDICSKVAADVVLRCVLIHISLLGIYTYHRLIRLELFNDCRFSLD